MGQEVITRAGTTFSRKSNAKYDNPKLLAKACRYALLGLSRSDCFRKAGIKVDTGFDWMRYGRNEPEQYPLLAKFVRVFERCEAHFNAQCVEVVTDAALSRAPNTWQAGMTLLERRDPENWGRRDKKIIEGGDKPLIQLNQVVLGDEGTRELSRELLRNITAASPHQPLGLGMGDEPDEGNGRARPPDLEVAPRSPR